MPLFTQLPRRLTFSETQRAIKEPGLLDPGHIVLLTLDAARNIMGRYEEHEGVHPLLGTRSI